MEGCALYDGLATLWIFNVALRCRIREIFALQALKLLVNNVCLTYLTHAQKKNVLRVKSKVGPKKEVALLSHCYSVCSG